MSLYFFHLQEIDDAKMANGKKNDDADGELKCDTVKFMNGQTNIYKSKSDTTPRTRHYVGSAN